MTEGTLLELLDGHLHQEYWTVRIINPDGTPGKEGLVPSTYLKDASVESDEDVKEKSKSLEYRE